MRATWPIDLERATHLVAAFRPLLDEVGERRFLAGVDAIIAKRPAAAEDGFRLGFPLPSELRSYIPPDPRLVAKAQREREEWLRLQREREANPDAFFGIDDVRVMMRLVSDRVAKKQRVIPSQIVDEVLQIRHTILESRKLEGKKP